MGSRGPHEPLRHGEPIETDRRAERAFDDVDFQDDSEQVPSEALAFNVDRNLNPKAGGGQFKIGGLGGNNHNDIVKPLDGATSDYERRRSLQTNIGRASEEAVTLAENSLHIGVLAHKLPRDHKEGPGFDVTSWPKFCAGEGSNVDGYTITKANFKAYLMTHPDPVKSKYAIIDLRNPKSHHDFPLGSTHTHIKGALHEPVDENNVPGTMLSIKDLKVKLSDQVVSFYKSNWQKALQRQPWSSLKDKDLVFIHCRQSINRTPYIATGYLEFGRPENSHQKVIILEGGFDNFDWPGLTEKFSV